MSDIYFIRHGFTPANNVGYNKQEGVRNVIIDDDKCPLDKEYGIKQVAETGEFLSEELKGKKILFYVSPHTRTKETLAIIYEKIKNNVDSIDIKEEKSICEINQGLAYATTPNELYEVLGEEAKIFQELHISTNSLGVSFPMGESMVEAKRRVRHFDKQLKKQRVEGRYDAIVIVSHFDIIKLIHELLTGEMPPKQYTASVIKVGSGLIYVPKTVVPKGYEIPLENYQVESEICGKNRKQ